MNETTTFVTATTTKLPIARIIMTEKESISNKNRNKQKKNYFRRIRENDEEKQYLISVYAISEAFGNVQGIYRIPFDTSEVRLSDRSI